MSSLIFSGCSDVRLVPIEKPKAQTKGSGEFCVSPPQSLARYTKFLFVMDKSGSNSGTDPGALKRANNIEAFYNANATNPYYRWGMLRFSGDASEALIYKQTPDAPVFTDKEELVRDGLTRLRGAEGGETPYGAALQFARRTILIDRETYPQEDSMYMVFFVSDGDPTDTENQQTLASYVQDLVSASPDRVFLSTAFYGPNGLEAEAILQRMAQDGLGKYVNFNNSDKLDFNDLIVGPTAEPWQLKKFLVYNLNAGFCEDGKVDVDSDGDGLCDKDEVKYPGFDPTHRFSFQDGYGDYFHWREQRFGEALPKCQDRQDEDFDLLTNCEEAYIRNRNAPGNVPQNGDARDPDTDRDGYIDGIETFVYFMRTMAMAMDPFNVKESLHDGEQDDAGSQMSQHRNPLIIDPTAIRYDTLVTPVGINAQGQTCYSFSQSVLPLYEVQGVPAQNTLPQLAHGPGENVVLVYYLETPQSEPLGAGVYRYSYQVIRHQGRDSVNGGAGELRVDDQVFTDYIVPERK